MIEIQPADIVADAGLLVESLRTHLTARSDMQRHAWLYRQNPHGQALAWIARDTTKQLVVGSGAIIPRRMWYQGAPQMACVMADFWVHPDYRTLGPAVKLQRACVAGAHALGFGFCDMPQASMPAVYRRLGLSGDKVLVRSTKLLSVDHHLARLCGSRRLGSWLARPLNAALRLYDRRPSPGGRCDIDRSDEPFGPEYTRLARDCAGQYAICVHRDAQYLQWRYRSHYFLRHQVYTARRSGVLQAYLVVADVGGNAQIMDLFGTPDRGVILDLLLGAAAGLRRDYPALYATLSGTHPLATMLAAAGFVSRARLPLVAQCFGESGQPAGDVQEWSLCYGDIDF